VRDAGGEAKARAVVRNAPPEIVDVRSYIIGDIALTFEMRVLRARTCSPSRGTSEMGPP